MRKLHSHVSTLGNLLVRQGRQLIVRDEALRSLCASIITLLHSYASRLEVELRDALRHGPLGTYGMKPRVLATARCFATAKQRQRRHDWMCRRPVA